MGTVYLTIGIVLMVLAGVVFAAGQLYLRDQKNRLEEYFYSIYGEGGTGV